MDGILNVYKQKGPTSHDVVDELRHILGIRRIGHAGTLDPEAEGVLPVCVGKATKLSSMISDSGKTYRTVMLLGVITDTQDMTGNIISQRPAVTDEEEIKAVIYGFLGPYDQIPPMYSARKIGGKKLYELAREGREVERQPKKVEITSVTVDDIALPRVVMTVDCTKGTYIRTLCHDIGRKLGCGACMESLIRTRVGRFKAQDALTVAQIKEMNGTGTLEKAVLPPDGIFSDLPSLTAAAGTAGDKFLHNGNPVPYACLQADKVDTCPGGSVRIYDTEGNFIGLYSCDETAGTYKPVTLFI